MISIPFSSELDCQVCLIPDSRQRTTVSVWLSYHGLKAYGDVPAGASKGSDEAKTVSPEEAKRQILEVLFPLLKSSRVPLSSVAALRELESRWIEQAGPQCSHIAANALLPMSRALWALASQMRGEALFQTLRSAYPGILPPQRRTHFLMNIFNGGLHALKTAEHEKLGEDRIDIQEIMIVPCGAQTYRQALQWGDEIDHALGQLLLQHYPQSAITRADEAGYSVKGLGDSTKAIEFVFQSIAAAGLRPGQDVQLALDLAASSFYRAEQRDYWFQGRAHQSTDMIQYLEHLCTTYPGAFFSVEDGLDENDWEHWSQLTQCLAKHHVYTVGDDLFVTQHQRLRRGIAEKAASAILIKVNQNGSVGGTLDVMAEAAAHGIECIVSHRSGETLDDSIADLALATHSLGLKTGDPQAPFYFPDRNSWVRRCKYLRMIQAEGITT